MKRYDYSTNLEFPNLRESNSGRFVFYDEVQANITELQSTITMQDLVLQKRQAEIDALKDSLAAENDLKTRNAELFNQLYAMHKSFSEDMYIKARRELEDVLEKNKQEKE